MKRMLIVAGLIITLGAFPLLAQETEEEEEPLWIGSLGLAWVATSGNTDTSTLGLDFTLDRRPEPWGFEFAARGNRADDGGVTTAENYLVSARAVRKLSTRWEAFGGLAWARDPFAGFDSQTVAMAGATYITVESKRHLLKLDAGLAYTWESRVPPAEDVDFAGGLLGLSWEWRLGANSKFTERFVFHPNFDDSADWRSRPSTRGWPLDSASTCVTATSPSMTPTAPTRPRPRLWSLISDNPKEHHYGTTATATRLGLADGRQ
jgi:putative salt-induced outer membrane protein